MKKKIIALNTRQNEIQGRGFVQELPLSDYDKLTHEDWLCKLAVEIANATCEEQQRKLKSKLPFRCPHYTRFVDNHRIGECIIPEAFTWMSTVDIDDPKQVEEAKKRALELNSEKGMWKDMLKHMDYSARRKLHIDILLPIGMTVPEAQRAYCKALGVEPDTTCFTPERFIYITPDSYEIYRAEDWCEQLPDEEVAKRRQAYLDRGLGIDGRKTDGRYEDEDTDAATNTPKEEETGKSVEHGGEKTFPCDFKGVPYEKIINEYWERNGGVPTVGERNDKLHKLACNLRAICDDDEGWLLAVMPRLGISEQEMKGIVHSACKEPTKGSKVMESIVDGLLNNVNSGEEAHDMGMKMSLGKLPMGLKESLKGVSPSMQMPLLCSVLPIAATYADQVEVDYCDNQRQQLGLMSIIKGAQTSGKSLCKYAVAAWRKLFDEEDEQARQREDEWKEKKRNCKANEKVPDEPHEVIRVVPVTISCSGLLRRLKNAKGHAVYSFSEEVDTLVKSNVAGSWSEKYDIYRYSFDRAEWGQDYVSDQSESGMVKVAYNWTLLGTEGSFNKMFKQENIENGLSSRVLLSQMPDTSFSKMPKYSKLTADDEARIREAAQRLRNCSGYVNTPQLRKVIEEWGENKRLEAAKDIDHVKDIFRRRSAVIGFRCGVIFHLLTGTKRESKACLEFAVMMADYCLEQQIKNFGSMLQKEQQKNAESNTRRSVNKSVFDSLPSVFTLNDVSVHKKLSMPRNSLIQIISRWNKDGLIEKISNQEWKKV